MRRVGSMAPGRARIDPRASSFFSTPLRFAATRFPGPTESTFWLCRCKPRIRTTRPPGTTSISSPTLIGPSTSVPVTTVPKPLIVNTRSIGRRGRPESGRAGDFSSSASRASTRSERPCRLGAETLMTEASSREVPWSCVTTSAEPSSSHSWSTRSTLEWLELVSAEVVTQLQGTSLEDASVIRVSAPSRQGLSDLVDALDALLEKSPARPDSGRPRLPIDRVFTMSGFGTVVTGTLVDGPMSVGDEMEVVPGGRVVRIRGLQRHNQKVDTVGPGNRVAANLSGVEKNELARGSILARPGAIEPTRRIDATLRVLASSPRAVRHGADFLLNTGTAEVGCRVIVLEGDEIAAGARGWVQLYLDRAIAADGGDRFVLRVPSPAITVAGGSFVDVAPRKHPRHDSEVRDSLIRRAEGDVLQEELRKYPRGVTVRALLKATVAPEADVGRLRARRLGEWIFSDDAWHSVAARAKQELDAFHSAYPLRAGMAREELRSRLGVPAA